MEIEKRYNSVPTVDWLQYNLNYLRTFIETEISDKKITIKALNEEIGNLKEVLRRKDEINITLERKLKEYQDSAEGNRQLINKLLSDISRLQNDVDWFRRTYEKRSFLGVIKEKLFRKK